MRAASTFSRRWFWTEAVAFVCARSLILWVEFFANWVILTIMNRSLFLLFLCSALILQGKTAEEVISKARSFVGPEEKIEAVDSLLYSGVLEPAGGGTGQEVSLLLEKPASQRLEITQGDRRITMTVNKQEGFIVQENLATGEKGVAAMPLDQVRRFKANAAENLYFFRFPAGAQVRTKYLGEQEFRGEMLDAVRFLHSGGVQFIRYFDPETGKLAGTQTDTGSINVEEGVQSADGLRFGEKVLSFEGDELVHTITFEKIIVNPEIPEGTFSYPK